VARAAVPGRAHPPGPQRGESLRWALRGGGVPRARERQEAAGHSGGLGPMGGATETATGSWGGGSARAAAAADRRGVPAGRTGEGAVGDVGDKKDSANRGANPFGRGG